jgi:hypothetical protein
MSKDKVVGHKTFYDNGHYRHEPLMQSEASEIMARIDKEKEKRADDMPTEESAAKAMWRAYYRLKELGWNDAKYAHELKVEGKECLLIEPGSSGIHTGVYRKVRENDVWWTGEEGWPSHPCLVKAKP